MADGSSHELNLAPAELIELSGREAMLREELQNPSTLDPNEMNSARRIARADRIIASIIQDVPIPANLAARVLAPVREIRDTRATARTRRRLAVAVVSLAASLFLFAIVQPFGRPALDAESVAARMADIHATLLHDGPDFVAGHANTDLPVFINSRTCVGHQHVELFGRQWLAYRLVNGADQAVLVSMPITDFPFQIGHRHVVTRDSTRQVDVHYFVSGGSVSILVARDGTDISKFRSAAGLT